MRAPFVALVVAAIVAATASAAPTAATTLRITYWEDSAAPVTTTWTLRCNPAGGSLARPGRACAHLLAGGTGLFAPLRKDVMCTEIYGGPQKARVVGTVRGQRIRSTFTRRNGCEIARWQRISPWLVPPGGVTG